MTAESSAETIGLPVPRVIAPFTAARNELVATVSDTMVEVVGVIVMGDASVDVSVSVGETVVVLDVSFTGSVLIVGAVGAEVIETDTFPCAPLI